MDALTNTLTLDQVLELTGGRLSGDRREAPLTQVTIDSRNVPPGALFVALRGDRFDGHDYAAQAVTCGAAAVLVQRPLELPLPVPQICVGNTELALGQLGRAARRAASDALVIGITGTNGKTGTKDLTAAALRSSLATVASRSSYNNSVGVPLTLLNVQRDTRAVVVELGTNNPGEIVALAQLAEPEVGVITNVHAGHLQGLGSLAGVRAEKGSLLGQLVGRRVSVLNRDDPSFPSLSSMAPGEIVTFGLSADADVRATDVRCSLAETRFTLGDGRQVVLAHLGRHAVLNALAALACVQVAGACMDGAIAALAQVPPPPGRLQIRRRGSLTLLDDSYNANPGSLAAAVATVSELGHPGSRVFVVGDMLELGEAAHELHRAAGRSIAQCFPRVLVAVGRHAEAVVSGAIEIGMLCSQALAFQDRAAAQQALSGLLRPGDLVLVKGSRRMALDALVGELPEPARDDEAALAS